MSDKEKVNLFWFRRDLRLEDNVGLHHALSAGRPVVPLFIFDRNILDELDDTHDRRVEFIDNCIGDLQQVLVGFGSTMDVRFGFPTPIFAELITEYDIDTVFTNHDYEPYARERDAEIGALLQSKGIGFRTYKDQVIFENGEIIKDNGQPYTVFTPYSKKWKSRLNNTVLKTYNAQQLQGNWFKQEKKEFPSLQANGFQKSGRPFPSKRLNENVIKDYSKLRNFPAAKGTSKMGIHLRFGTVSIRQMVTKAGGMSETYLNELIWREFYQMILWHFPQVVHRSFKPEYDNIHWRNNEKEFEAWCKGQTGYPIVDAGMRQLNETGFMHNRVRMITASFLTKHLLIDWRWGEAYFAKKLLDYDLASNNGGWQWAAGSGCDAAPYFRIFNPTLQTKKFDPELRYVREWVPEFEEFTYPKPIVEHEFARKRCLEEYSRALKNILTR